MRSSTLLYCLLLSVFKDAYPLKKKQQLILVGLCVQPFLKDPKVEIVATTQM